MKIIAEETVVRYHVEFDEEETILLKSLGILPPHAAPRARLWSTMAEINETHALIARARAAGANQEKTPCT
jgi:hypothetical protein